MHGYLTEGRSWLERGLSSDVDVTPIMDRTTTIKASLAETEKTLAIAIFLVVLVVFVFLREPRATLADLLDGPGPNSFTRCSLGCGRDREWRSWWTHSRQRGAFESRGHEQRRSENQQHD